MVQSDYHLFNENFIVKIYNIMYLEHFADRNWFAEQINVDCGSLDVKLWIRHLLRTYSKHRVRRWPQEIILSSMRVSQ